jgi:hypothetical protein
VVMVVLVVVAAVVRIGVPHLCDRDGATAAAITADVDTLAHELNSYTYAPDTRACWHATHNSTNTRVNAQIQQTTRH